MSDTASTSRPVAPSPVPDEAGKARATAAASPSDVARPKDDQPTILSRRPPMPVPTASDSTYRILQGKIVAGDRLGHFELVEYVGGGGMGRVYRAVDTGLSRTVALKVLPPEQAADEETLRRFRNEAQSAARLDHENIARVYHVGEDQGLHYIAFEFIEGINIRGLVERKGPLPLTEALSYTLQIAEALAHADGRNVVHRDIKPSNVLITPEGHVKLIDMGLARLREAGTSSGDLTASGVTLGTFDYISPEQARDPRNADVRSDIYSLGCTFFYMLAGQPPFPEGTVLQKLLQHQGDQPPDVQKFRPELPDEVGRVLRKMLAKDPRHRYHDPACLVDDLLTVADQLGLHSVSRARRILATRRERGGAFLRRHLPWVAPIAALVCIVVLLEFVSRQYDATPPALPNGPAAAHRTQREPPPGRAPEQPPKTPEPQETVSPEPADGQDIEPPKPPDVGGPGDEHPSPPEASPPEEPPQEPAAAHPLGGLVAGRSASNGLQIEPFESSLSLSDGSSGLLSVAPTTEATGGELTGAAGAAAEPVGVGPAVDPGSERTELLVVTEEVQGENEFPTLAAACSAAKNNDVIEVRYNGRQVERPVTLTNLKLTIRAGEGYQPVIVFRPDQNDIDPVKYSRSMFTLTAVRLTLVNMALELDVPRDVPADNWSLFETRGGQTVHLEHSSLTIRNASDQLGAYHQDVAFFRAKPAPESGLVMTENGSVLTPLATIELDDCIARGEALFLCAPDLQQVRLVWNTGLLVTTERLLSAYGGQQAPQLGEMLQIELRHVTAVVRNGFCRTANSPFTPYQLNTLIDCSHSILIGTPGSPVIEQIDADPTDDFQQQITWNGQGVFYEDFDLFWAVRSLDQETPAELMTTQQWKSRWGPEDENPPILNQVAWKQLPEPNRPLHTHTPADYALSKSTETNPNPAVGAAGKGGDAGFQADRLPALPATPAAKQHSPDETSN